MTQLNEGALAVGRLRLALSDLTADLRYLDALVDENEWLREERDRLRALLVNCAMGLRVLLKIATVADLRMARGATAELLADIETVLADSPTGGTK